MARQEVLCVVTHGFIGYYGDVRGTDMESLCWRGETDGHAPRHPSLAFPLRVLLLHITHDFYHYDLMFLLKNFCTRQ